MVLTPHMLAGGALAKYIRHPLLLAPLAFILHLLLDITPHWEYDIMAETGKVIIKVGVDLTIGLVVLFFIIRRLPIKQQFLIAWGGFFGLLPDGISFIYYASHKTLFLSFTHFHIFFHELIISHGTHPPLWFGLLLEITVIAISLFLLLRWRRFLLGKIV